MRYEPIPHKPRSHAGISSHFAVASASELGVSSAVVDQAESALVEGEQALEAKVEEAVESIAAELTAAPAAGAKEPETQSSAKPKAGASSKALSSEMCHAMLRDPTHLFRRMWSAEAWAHMQPGASVCWERKRDERWKPIPAATFFEEASAGTHCDSNWYEGNSGDLGKHDYRTTFAKEAPALLGFDETIDKACSNHDGQHAKSCIRASKNILSLYGDRVPYNLCRNLEWQACDPTPAQTPPLSTQHRLCPWSNSHPHHAHHTPITRPSHAHLVRSHTPRYIPGLRREGLAPGPGFRSDRIRPRAQGTRARRIDRQTAGPVPRLGARPRA